MPNPAPQATRQPQIGAHQEPRYTILRVLAICMVVYNHSSEAFNLDVADSLWLLIGVHIKQIIFTAVPLFVMLSGALLLNKNESPSVFFKKRLKKILIPFILWSVLVFILYRYKHHIPLDVTSFGDCARALLTVGTFGVYWYIYLIISLYLITPFLRVIVQNMSLHMVALLCALPLFWHFVGGYFPEVSIALGWHFPWAIYLFYFLAGYLLSKIYIYPRLIKNIASFYDKASVVLGILFIFLYICFGCTEWAWTEVPASLGIFILILHIPQALAEKAAKKVQFLSKASYGIYLSHFILISGIVQIGLFNIYPVWAQGLCTAATVLALNTLLFFVLEKCRLAKWFM